MIPKYHIAFGFILSLVLFLLFPSTNLIGAGIIFLSSFLIDVDHYIYYIFKERSLSLKKAIDYFLIKRRELFGLHPRERKRFYSGFCFLHGIEILVILFVSGIFISEYFLFILIGFAFHLLLDIIEEIYRKSRLDKISIIYDWFKFKKLKKI